VKVRWIDRKSCALTSSSLRCLSHVPTINLAAGCIHNCAYCYIRGYSQYPGDDVVAVYRDTADQVERELRRKRKRPTSVYFSPSSDAFMPVEAVLEQAYRTMQVLLRYGVGVEFATKGAIPCRFFDLFGAHRGLIAGQIGLTSVDDKLNAVLEPGAPAAKQRLDDIGRLSAAGAHVSLRVDPLIHGVTDDDAGLTALFAAAATRGVRAVSASYLFLRPAIVGSLRRSIDDHALLQRILLPFDRSDGLQIRTGNARSAGSGTNLPVDVRRAGFERVRTVAKRHGLELHTCGCKNSDMTATRCRLTQISCTAATKGRGAGQPMLW
jgi:DNA repair photolyase